MTQPPHNLTIITSPEGMRGYPLAQFLDEEVEARIADLRARYGAERVTVRRMVGDFTYAGE